MGRMALSLKQPWAALLASGRKTIEVRKWTTRYRGELLIHAARIDDDRPEAWAHVDDALRPLARRRGGVIGVGKLAEVRSYRAREDFASDRPHHLNDADWFDEQGLFGFRFDRCRVVPFVVVAGNVRLFSLDVEIADASALPDPVPLPVPLPVPVPVPVPETAAPRESRFRRLLRTLLRRPAEGE